MLNTDRFGLGEVEDALRSTFPDRFAGLWVEEGIVISGPIVLHIALAPMEADDDDVTARTLTAIAPDISYKLHGVRYSEERLKGYLSPFLSLPLEQDLPEELVGVEISVPENVVMISVSSAPTGRLAELISSIPAEAVRLFTGSYEPLT